MLPTDCLQRFTQLEVVYIYMASYDRWFSDMLRSLLPHVLAILSPCLQMPRTPRFVFCWAAKKNCEKKEHRTRPAIRRQCTSQVIEKRARSGRRKRGEHHLLHGHHYTLWGPLITGQRRFLGTHKR